MKPQNLSKIVLMSIGLIVALVATAAVIGPWQRQEAKPAAAHQHGPGTDEGGDALSLPPLSEISPQDQIKLALSAAPAEISSKADIYVLKPKGYVKVRTGTNGFSCLVEHEQLDTLEPTCYDLEGSQTTLLARFYREELRLSGVPEDQLQAEVEKAYAAGKLIAPRKPGISYMLSKQGRVWDPFNKQIIPSPPHLMFYAPYATARDFGGFNGVELPHVLWEGRPDAKIIVVPAWLASVVEERADFIGVK